MENREDRKGVVDQWEKGPDCNHNREPEGVDMEWIEVGCFVEAWGPNYRTYS